jgi:uncharacterized membrane protein YbhN (UPF0104 family)
MSARASLGSYIVRVALGFALLWFLASSNILDWNALGGLAAHWPLTLAAFALVNVAFVFTSWRSCRLFAARGLRLSLGDSIRLTLIGVAANMVLPLVGSDVTRLLYTARGQPGRRTEIGTVILIDRVLGLAAMLALPVLLAPWFLDVLRDRAALRWLTLLSAALTAGAMLAIGLPLSRSFRTSRLLNFLLDRLPFRAHVHRVADTLHAYRSDPAALVWGTLASLASHGLVASSVVILHLALLPGSVEPRVAFLASLGFVSYNIPITPGAIGIAEAAFATIFQNAGLSAGAEAMLGLRFLMLALVPAGVWLYIRGPRQVLRSPEEPTGVSALSRTVRRG